MNKNILFSFIVTIFLSLEAFTQNEINVRFDGMYIAKTGEIDIPNNKLNIYTYLRFYEEGTVYLQTVNGYDPIAVAKWFGKDGSFSKKGEYQIVNNSITFMTNNNQSSDQKLVGKRKMEFTGKIITENKLLLNLIDNEGDENKDIFFEFTTID